MLFARRMQHRCQRLSALVRHYTVMRCTPSVWCVWSLLGTILLKTSLILLLSNGLSFQSSPIGSFVTPASPHAKNLLCEETPEISQEFSRECVHLSRQMLAPVCSCDLHTLMQQGAKRLRPVPAQIVLPTFFFLPRKLPPTSTDNVPFWT